MEIVNRMKSIIKSFIMTSFNFMTPVYFFRSIGVDKSKSQSKFIYNPTVLYVNREYLSF